MCIRDRNDTGHASDEVYPDLGALIQMDIEEEEGKTPLIDISTMNNCFA